MPESNATKSGRDRAVLLAEREGLSVRQLAVASVVTPVSQWSVRQKHRR